MIGIGPELLTPERVDFLIDEYGEYEIDQKLSGVFGTATFGEFIAALQSRKALAQAGATLSKLDRTNAELSDALIAAMDCVAGGLKALNATVLLNNAEMQGHDRTADRLDKEIQAWRAIAKAMLSACNPTPKATPDV